MGLFKNPPPTLKYIYGFVALFVLWVSLSTCRASEPYPARPEFELGIGKTYLRGPAPIASATVIWPKQIGNIDLYAGAVLIGSYKYADKEWPNQIVVRAGVTANYGNVGLSLGVATFQNDDLLNSGRLQFNLGLQYKYGRRVVLHAEDHFSNAGSHPPNTGRDMYSAGFRFFKE